MLAGRRLDEVLLLRSAVPSPAPPRPPPPRPVRVLVRVRVPPAGAVLPRHVMVDPPGGRVGRRRGGGGGGEDEEREDEARQEGLVLHRHLLPEARACEKRSGDFEGQALRFSLSRVAGFHRV